MMVGTPSFNSRRRPAPLLALLVLLALLALLACCERAAAGSISQQGVKQAAGAGQPAAEQAAGAGAASKRALSRRSEALDDEQPLPLAAVNNHSSARSSNATKLGPAPRLRPPQAFQTTSRSAGASAAERRANKHPNTPPRSPQRNANSSAAHLASSSNSISAANSPLSPKSRSGLPECATQQVCNAIFVRMNYTQRLCECSQNYNWKCSNNLDPQDGHTIELTRKFDKRIYTQIKTCEPLREVRACKSPTDWTLLALQSERSGKAHYVVVCKCPTWAQLEGPYTHNHPPYANIPGIRVYGMLCAHQTARSSSAQTYSAHNPALTIYPEFPWSEALNVLNTTNLATELHSH